MQRFSELGPGEAVVLTFNYTLFLPPGVLLAGLPVVTWELIYGNDPNPAAQANGSPTVDQTGMLVLQPVIGGMDATDYLVIATCLTTNEYWAPALPAILPVRLCPSRTGAP